jgi:hypothetical protein
LATGVLVMSQDEPVLFVGLTDQAVRQLPGFSVEQANVVVTPLAYLHHL